jgi:hypothetical protein
MWLLDRHYQVKARQPLFCLQQAALFAHPACSRPVLLAYRSCAVLMLCMCATCVIYVTQHRL